MVKHTHGIPSRHRFRAGFVNNAHYILLFVLGLFVLAAVLLGEFLNMYNSVWWWDDMLHGLSGTILGFIGLLAIYFFNSRYNMAISPLLVAVFVFCFAITVGVLWEIYEFLIDMWFQASMQRWNSPPNSIIIGQSYQGIGLRDTMSDLMIACVGALIATGFSYVAYKYEKNAVLGIMRRTFWWRVRR